MIRATLRLRRLAILTGGLCLALAACGKADRKKCELSCRNYATITFREIEAKDLPAAQHEAALTKKLTDGLPFCVSKCQSANNDEQSDCRIAARKLTELKACD